MSKWKKVALWKKILIGVVIGLIIGLVSPKAAEVISPLGDIFLRMLKMLIVPLVFFSITSGVCKMGDVKQLRTVGIRYVLWIIASAVIAAICGVIGGLIVQPGRGTTEFLAAAEAAEAQSYSFIDNVISWFPTNIVESMANANMLQIIVFCLFLGVALLALGDKAKTVIRFIDEGSEVMLKITEYVIEFSPFGILCSGIALVCIQDIRCSGDDEEGRNSNSASTAQRGLPADRAHRCRHNVPGSFLRKKQQRMDAYMTF